MTDAEIILSESCECSNDSNNWNHGKWKDSKSKWKTYNDSREWKAHNEGSASKIQHSVGWQKGKHTELKEFIVSHYGINKTEKYQ